jgi:hypothetical protein
MPSKHTRSFVIPADVQREIDIRTADNASAALATMLRRYAALLAESRRHHRATFTAAELTFLRDLLADATTGQSVATALDLVNESPAIAVPDGIDMASLDARLRALDPVDDIALLDSIERARIQERAGKRIVVTPP